MTSLCLYIQQLAPHTQRHLARCLLIRILLKRRLTPVLAGYPQRSTT